MPTAQLWKQLGAPYLLEHVAPSADSVLGDWSLKSVDVRQGRFIVGVNERTLMAVVFGQRHLPQLAGMVASCVGAQLEVFGIPPDRIVAEVAAIKSSSFGKTRDRSVLGILNEVAFMFEAAAEESAIATANELLAIQTELNGIPHRATSRNCVFAHDAIVALLGTVTFH